MLLFRHSLFATIFGALLVAATTPHLKAAPVAPLSIRDVDGTARHLPDASKRATVLIFSAVDCPISNSYAPEVNRLMAQFASQKIAFFLIYPDGDTDPKKARRHARAFGYTCPLVLDAKQNLARRFGASVTPEVVVLSAQAKVLYRGRIDDRYVTWGKKRAQPSRRELFDALQAVSRGRQPVVKAAPAIGCFIPNVGSTRAPD